MDQRMKLAPHMIQSMEILQLPILALQERIEQELNNNPVLELEEPAGEDEAASVEDTVEDDDLAERDLVVDTDNNKADDFERLDGIEDDFKEFINQSGPYQRQRDSEEKDRKLKKIATIREQIQRDLDRLALIV